MDVSSMRRDETSLPHSARRLRCRAPPSTKVATVSANKPGQLGGARIETLDHIQLILEVEVAPHTGGAE